MILIPAYLLIILLFAQIHGIKKEKVQGTTQVQVKRKNQQKTQQYTDIKKNKFPHLRKHEGPFIIFNVFIKMSTVFEIVGGWV